MDFENLCEDMGKEESYIAQTKMSLSEKQKNSVLWHMAIYVIFICWIKYIKDKIKF